MNYGNDYVHANLRLNGSAVRYRNVPMRVDEVTRDGDVVGEYLISSKRVVVKLDRVDVNPSPLGYLNKGGVAVYLSRAPMRNDWKQGTRRKNIRSVNYETRDLSWSDIGRAMKGKYPTIDECLHDIDVDGASSVAFSRSYAVDARRRLLYKGRAVGKFLPTGKVKFDGDFFYLYEDFEPHSEGRLK